MPAPATFTPTAERLLDSLGPLDAEPEANDYALQHFVSALAVGWDTVAEIIRDRDDGSPGFAVLFDPDECPADFLAWASQFVGVVMLPGLSEAQQRLRIKETGGAKRGTPSAIEGAARQFLKPAVAPFNYATNPSGELTAKWAPNGAQNPVTREASGTAGVPAYVGGWRDRHEATSISFGMWFGMLNITFPSAGQWVVSTYVWIPNAWDGGSLFLSDDGTFSGATGISHPFLDPTSPGAKGTWQRIYWIGTVTAGDLTGFLLLRYTGADPTVANSKLYTDAVQIEPAGLTDYADGDTAGHHWLGTPHASTTATDGDPADAAVYIIERHGSPYDLTVATLTAETPQADLVFRALQEQKPAGLKLTHVVVDGGIYTVLLGAFANYDAARANPAHT